MSNPCRICANPAWTDQAGTWAGEGIADREVARRLGVDKSLVTRHRQRHVIAPLQHRLAIAGKGDAPRRERQQLADAAATDAPTPGQLTASFLALDAITADLRTIRDRLERQADGAEQDGQRSTVAVIAQAQIRATETRAKLGGIGGFAPRAADPVGAGSRFEVSIIFSGGRQETISVVPMPGTTPAIDADEDADEEPAES